MTTQTHKASPFTHAKSRLTYILSHRPDHFSDAEWLASLDLMRVGMTRMVDRMHDQQWREFEDSLDIDV